MRCRSAPARSWSVASTIAAVACGALRRIPKVEGDIDGTGPNTAEIKRMYVAPEARGNKLGAAILDRLEVEAGALGIDHLVLETGSRQPEAIQMYERAGFTARDRWGSTPTHRTAGASRSDSTRRRSAPTGDQASGGMPSTWISPNGSTPTRRWVSHTSRGSG